jgi:uncharacterized membrane protein YfcA
VSLVFLGIGLFAGVTGGLLGVGGGFLIVPLLLTLTKLKPHQANATSLAAVVPLSLAGAVVYYFRAPRPAIDLRFALLLVIGSGVGAFVGARAVSRIPERGLQIALAVVLAGLGLKELVAP